MSRNRNKKRRYRLQAEAGPAGQPGAAVLEIEEDDGEDVEGFERALGKAADLNPSTTQPPDANDQILFIPIVKVDAQQREVWGRAAQEVRDHTDEILDYASSKPLFSAWVEDTFKRSGGKSKGNIRAMHQPIAAGKVIDFQANDGDKAFDIGTKIVDENEWQKVSEGVYTGFSIGGRYVRRWQDGGGLVRYTAEPREISLVDTPAIPTATFKLIKEDGSEELHKFVSYVQSGGVKDVPSVTTTGNTYTWSTLDLEKVTPAAPTPTKSTYVDTQVMMEPTPNTPLTVTQADAENAQLDSAKFIAAQNPNAGQITPADPGAPVPATKADAPKDLKPDITIEAVKAVQDIPGLAHIKEGDPLSCANCLHFRYMGDQCYCRKFDSMVRYDWVCNDWEKQSEHPDQTLIPLAETSAEETDPKIELAKPTADSDAAKAEAPADDGTPDNAGGAKAKSEAELKARGERVGIARKDGEPLTPPKGYPTDPGQYADPANWSWPCDKSRASTAVSYYNGAKGKDKYSPREWAVLGRRIARLAGAALNTRYKFDPKEKQITRIEPEAKKMEVDKNADIGTMLTQMRGLMDSDTPEARDQAKALLDVAIDTVSTPSSINPQTTATPTTMPTAAKAEDKTPPSTPPAAASSSDSKTPETSVPTKPAAKVEETPAEPVQKAEGLNMPDNVYGTQPPAPAFNIGHGDGFIKSLVPQFIDTMSDGADVNRLQKAYKRIAQEDPFAFDELYNASCYELAKMAGFTSKNMEDGSLPRRTVFGAGVTGHGPSVELAKAFNATTAPGIYLRRLLALMLPVLNPWRQRVYSTTPTTGSNQAIWRAVLGFQSTVLAMGMRSAEAGTTIGSTTGNGVPVDETPTSFTASFQSIKTNGVVTYKAIYTMRGYDDPVTVQLLESLTGVLRIEEMQNVIGNFAAVAAPGSITVTPSTSAGAVPAANYIVRVTSLTGQGWRLTQEIASYLGSGTYTINGTSQTTVGESAPRSDTAKTLGSTGELVCSWPSVPGALAYNVYVRDDTNNTEHWYSTVTSPEVTITSYPSTGNSGAAVSDTTANTLGFEGVLPWSVLSTVYSQTIPNKSSVVVDCAGAGLTLVAPNSVSQLDSIIEQQFTKWHIAPTLLLMSPKTTNHLTKIVGSATNPPQLIVIQQGPAQGQVIGGLAATGYINRFSPWLSNAPSVIPILAHPYVPDGTISVLCETIPYPNAREGRGWTLETLRPYTYIPLANLTDHIPFELAVDELLECNHPSAQGQVYGIDVS